MFTVRGLLNEDFLEEAWFLEVRVGLGGFGVSKVRLPAH